MPLLLSATSTPATIYRNWAKLWCSMPPSTSKRSTRATGRLKNAGPCPKSMLENSQSTIRNGKCREDGIFFYILGNSVEDSLAEAGLHHTLEQEVDSVWHAHLSFFNMTSRGNILPSIFIPSLVTKWQCPHTLFSGTFPLHSLIHFLAS